MDTDEKCSAIDRHDFEVTNEGLCKDNSCQLYTSEYNIDLSFIKDSTDANLPKCIDNSI